MELVAKIKKKILEENTLTCINVFINLAFSYVLKHSHVPITQVNLTGKFAFPWGN